MDNNLITAGIVAASATITQLINMARERQKRAVEERNRRWDLEDRRNRAAIVEAALHHQAESVATTAKDHAEQVSTVLDEIKKNTQLSVNAFNEANSVNTKILKLHARIDAMTLAAVPDCSTCANYLDAARSMLEHACQE